MIQTIQVKRGLKSNLPILLMGEFGFCTDTKELFIGDGSKNTLLGQMGATGAQGIQGIQGIQGLKGDKGDKGDTGAKGDVGLQGPIGLTGPIGIQGLKGNDGYTPIKGIDYFDGAKGDTGLTGANGAKGDEGADGLTTSIKLGTTQYNQSGGIISLPAYPTSLPASGGNADTVDGKHANDFAPSGYGLGSALANVVVSDSKLGLSLVTGMYYASSVDPNKPSGVADGALFVMAYSSAWVNQIYLDWRTNKTYRRMCTNGAWNDWEEVATVAQIISLLNLKANVASPTFTGTPKSTTPVIADNSTNIATTAFVKAQGYITSAGSGARITTSTTAPSSPSSGEFWYKEI